MLLRTTLILFPLLVLVTAQLEKNCLACLCEVSGGCLTKGCDYNYGSGRRYCGPFTITHETWTLAGELALSPSRPADFEECTTDLECSARVLEGYMDRYSQDCNGDGVVTCTDHHLTWSLGVGCGGGDQTLLKWLQKKESYARFLSCTKALNITM